ncbi:hypothetical protein ACIOC2_13300 [Streptomyces sp. NPDC088337]|uniref:hypothetical protein n=1 Tax=unclassified Streptomyces TaxID=2593676 RepID=UPI0037F2823F
MTERTKAGRAAAAMAGALLTVAAAGLTAPAASAAPAPVPAKGGPFCAYLMGKKTTTDTSVSVVRQACSTQSDADAYNRLQASSSTLLMTWYADAGYSGTSANVYGSYGTCDTAGYGFTPDDWWKKHMSSIKGSGQCNKVRLTNIAGTYADSYSLPVSFGATIYNDNVGYVKVWHG